MMVDGADVLLKESLPVVQYFLLARATVAGDRRCRQRRRVDRSRDGYGDEEKQPH
jgi:hypothetical protein